MRKLNKTLIALAISTTLLSACNKNDEPSRPTPAQKSDIENVAANNDRFVSYNTIQTAEVAARSAETTTIPAAPAIPEGAVNMMNVDGNGKTLKAWEAKKGTNYYLPEGTVWSDQVQFADGINYYIAGTLALNFYGTQSNINILPKGTLKIQSSQAINNLNIRSWGTIDMNPNNNLVIGFGTSFINYSNCEIKASKMQNQGEFEHYGDITLTSDLDCSGYNSSFTVHGSVAASFMKASNSSKSTVDGNIVTKTGVEVNGNTTLKVGASIVVEDAAGRVYITNNSTIDIADYIKCGTLELDSNAKLLTHIETLIMCDNLKYKNNTAKISNVDMEGVYTVIVTPNLEEAWDSIDRMNGGGIDLHTPVEEYEDLDWTANVIFNGPTYIPEKGLRPEYGVRPVDPEPVYTLNHIGSIKSIDKECVSATSIDFINNLAYFSWHKRGEAYDGYIDVANINNKTILSTLHSSSQDFNSISVLGNEICAVGAEAKGAIVSNINYSNAEVTAEYSYIEGASANSVMNVMGSKWITTNSGITIIPENKFIELDRAKYAVAADDKVVVLAGTPDASLYVFEQNGELVNSFSCGTIAIENGKNTIYADGDKIYVSLGVAGLRSYDLQGNLLNEFSEVGEGAVNGVSADEEFIYVACGLAGLKILDKTDFEPVKTYTLNQASANFVKKAADGLIYVAYGLNGIHILELQVQ